MSEENAICKICGGHLKVVGHRIEPTYTNGFTSAHQWIGSDTRPLCPGHPESHPPHKYCPKCEQWRDVDGICCGACGTMLVLRRLTDIPTQVEKHDGCLNGRNPYRVQIIFPSRGKYSSVRVWEVTTDEAVNDIWLAPKQALSLLKWLRQEEETLKRLAKEREG